jgi:3-phenylpropionate/trans-cinnamate dioxygenase ferredoxin subunit
VEPNLKPNPPGIKKHIVGRTSDIAEGERLLMEIDGRPIGVYHIKGQFYALLDRCPHLGGPLCKGQVVSEVSSSVPGDIKFDASKTYVTCPWHNWEFDIKTGQSYWNPKGLRARPFPVGVEKGEALCGALENGSAERVAGPFRAETIQVDVEGDYLVIAMRSNPASIPKAPAADTKAANGGVSRQTA